MRQDSPFVRPFASVVLLSLCAAPAAAQVVLSGQIDQPIAVAASNSWVTPAAASATIGPGITFDELQPLSIQWDHPAGSLRGYAEVQTTITRQGPDALTAVGRLFAHCGPSIDYQHYSTASMVGGVLLSLTSPTPVDGVLVVQAYPSLGPGYGFPRTYVDLHDDGVLEHSTSCVLCPIVRSWHLQVTSVPTLLRIRVDSMCSSDLGYNSAGCTFTVRFATDLFGTWTPLGNGCTGGGYPAPVLDSATVPSFGVPFAMTVDQLPLAGPNYVFGLAGFDATSSGGQPLPADLTPLGLTGCTLYLHPVWFSLVQSPGATADLTLPLPPTLLGTEIGREFFVQALVMAPGANPFDALLSNAARGVIGW